MTEAAHLTDEQVSRYGDGLLPAPALLEIDEHLGACAPCRDRLYSELRLSSKIRAIRAELSEHLEYHGIVACSEGSGKADQLAHLRDCAMCRAEVQDLSRFRTSLADTPRMRRKAPVIRIGDWQRWRMPAAIAAAVVLIASGAVWQMRRERAAAELAAARRASIEPPLAPADQALVDRAVASNGLERAAVLGLLIVKPPSESAANADAFHLLSPIGTTVLSDRPLLRWTPAVDATTYVVSVFDEGSAKIAESPKLTGTDWRPPDPLPRGKVLIWHVTAQRASGSLRSPRPPEPEARFEVVPEETERHIQEVGRQHPGNPLLMAVLYAQAGALDDAQEALRAMDPSTAQRYKESLAKIRKAE